MTRRCWQDYFTVPVTGQRLKSRADSAVNSSIVPLLQAEAVEKGDSRRAVSANPAASVKFSEGLAPSRTQSVGGTRARGGSFALSRARLASQEWDGPREGHVFASTHLVQYVRESASYVYNNTVAWCVVCAVQCGRCVGVQSITADLSLQACVHSCVAHQHSLCDHWELT